MALKLALLGKIRSGKNTVADHLVSKYGFTEFALADGIEDVILDYFPDAFTGGKPRKHYQVIGQSFRELNPNVWIELLAEKLEGCKDSNVVITDVRQQNEVDFLQSEGFTVIEVHADDSTRIERIKKSGDVFTDDMLNHSTEQQVDHIQPDHIILNVAGIDFLHEQVDSYVQALVKAGAK